MHQSLRHLFHVLYLRVYVICAPSQLAPRIPFLYAVVRHTLSVCSFSTLRRFGRFASDYIDTANLPHRDFVFIHPSSSASLVTGRLNYGVVQAVSAANVRGSSHTRTWRALLVWTGSAVRICHTSYPMVLGISSPFSLPLPHYMSFRPSRFCSCGVPSVHGLSGPTGLPLFRVSSSQFSVVECGVFVGCQCSHICVPCALSFDVVCTNCM